MNLPPRYAYHADLVFLGEGPAIKDSAVVFDEHGTILDVGPAMETLPRHAGATVERLSGLLTPGLINAHVHLELSNLRDLVSSGDGFFPWVTRMLTARATVDESEAPAAIERAVREVVTTGTVAVGDVSNTLTAVHALARAGVAGIVFHEVYGYDHTRARQRLEHLPRERMDVVGAWPAGDLRYAPAPHSLYALHPDLVRASVRAAETLNVRTSLHLAEHSGEQEFLEHGTGPVAQFADFLGTDLNGFPVPRQRPVPYAQELGVLTPNVVLVHMTTASRSELDLVAAAGSPVVLCPRSNMYIERQMPPLLDVLAAGVQPALGTDSLASNTSLDLLAEAKVLADRFPSVPATTLWSMATAWGADALGFPSLGRLRPGARPGLLHFAGFPDEGANPVTTVDPLRPFLSCSPAHRRLLVNARPLS